MPPLPRIIHNLIAQEGPIPFWRFMELALYCPDYGFYEKEKDNVGRSGDFYTSVSVGPLFGELLAFQFARWLDAPPLADCGLRIVEAGAHDGRLAADILNWLRRQRPGVYGRTEYCLLESSARRSDWQRQTLAEFTGRVTWLNALPGLQSAGCNSQFTIVFANELLDALPVRRFGWHAAKHEWFEWGVVAEGDRFVWARLPITPSSVGDLPSSPKLLAVLPDGFTIEQSPAAEEWWGTAASWLQQGKLLTFDYGFGTQETLSPERPNGTLRAFRKHKHAEDILADPGEQDITAHVNFARIEQVGVEMGLTTELFEPQGRYLTRLAAEAWKPQAKFGEWDSKRIRQFQTLTHPQHLGHSFRVLVQSRG